MRLQSNANSEEHPRLRLAIQKEGRLTQHTFGLLRSVGLDFESYQQRLFSRVYNFDLDILFTRDDDIPEYVLTGAADLGVIGQNLVYETGVDVVELAQLEFGHCTLVLAVPKNSGISDVQQLQGGKIATSYPRSARAFLERHRVDAELIPLSGAVELAPNLGLASAVIEISATGSSLELNDLIPISQILDSEAVMIANRQSLRHPHKSVVIQRLLTRVNGALTGQQYKYIVMNAPRSSMEKIRNIVPGLKHPTIVPLTDPEWVAVHTVVREQRFWDVMEQLKAAGAGDILVIPIEKMLL